MKGLELFLHMPSSSFFDDRGQGREVNEAEQAGKVSFADFYDDKMYRHTIVSKQLFVSLFLDLLLFFSTTPFFVSSFFLY